MKQLQKTQAGFLQQFMNWMLENFVAKFESPRKREFKKLKRFIAG